MPRIVALISALPRTLARELSRAMLRYSGQPKQSFKDCALIVTHHKLKQGLLTLDPATLSIQGSGKVTISVTFNEQLFCAKVFCEAFSTHNYAL